MQFSKACSEACEYCMRPDTFSAEMVSPSIDPSKMSSSIVKDLQAEVTYEARFSTAKQEDVLPFQHAVGSWPLMLIDLLQELQQAKVGGGLYLQRPRAEAKIVCPFLPAW